MKSIMEDERKIKELVFPGPGENSISVGGGLVDEIIPYVENGEMAPVIWFAGLFEGEILYRYNSKYVDTISYV